ncbi:MAG TPA: 3-phosphoshikimate 1-carboxyvinyltransferase [Paludibacteraceae bacterium]|nr:3-phosphoshikimate 1-carboxyvinyltransferase [Paludibacteraceae bacterium]HPC26271.1 3-phosphoshikimate 1-carboxyvinyltransferase [Paludibacteraceae bacterium]HPO68094.1 3-phosphoshikimate 1-carboxyvinyltransferase [Paludibacteraceae bacterium]
MNKYLDKKISQIQARIKLPASKSLSNRALILNALAKSPYPIENLSDSDDTMVMINALNSTGHSFNVGAAGTAMRFLTAYFALKEGEWTLTGSNRMKQRPIKLLVDALNSIGGKIEYLEKEGFPPLKIYGNDLSGGVVHLNGGVSSQYISALMMIAPYMKQGLEIVLEGKIISKPYIEMTKSLMKDFGAEVKFENNRIIIPQQVYKPIHYQVESDWTAASYWYEALSIAGKGEIFLEGLNENSYQGDSKVAQLFEMLGVSTQYLSEGILLTPTGKYIRKFEYDFTDQPDLAQTFAVTCCLLNIPFHFQGLESLKIKETNRIAALINELEKLDYILQEPKEGELIWSGEKKSILSKEQPISISTYEDHRMAMAFAPVSFIMPITIENAEVVSKSYPHFWEDFEKIK